MTTKQLPAGTKMLIYHNYGTCTLENVTITEQLRRSHYDGSEFIGRIVRGTVVDGGVTNRLFHCASYTPYEKGKEMEWDIWSRPITEDVEGTYYIVNVEFC